MIVLVVSSLLASVLCVLAGYGNYGYGYNNGYNNGYNYGLNNYHNYPVKRVLFTHKPYFPQVYPPYNPYYAHRRPYLTRVIITKPIIKVLPPIYKTIKYPVKVKQPVIINKVPVIHKEEKVVVKKHPPIVSFGKPTFVHKDKSNQIPINSVDEKIPDKTDEAVDVDGGVESGVKVDKPVGVDGVIDEEQKKEDEEVKEEKTEEAVGAEGEGEEEVKKEEGMEETVKKEEEMEKKEEEVNGDEKKKENGGEASFEDYTDESKA